MAGLWTCSFCAFALGWQADVDVGPGYVSDTSLKFANYRGLDEEGGFLALSGEAHYQDESGRYFDFYAHELGVDSRRIRARGGQRGDTEFRLSYTELPSYRGFGTRTPFTRTAPDRVSLPGDWQPALDTGGMLTLDSSLQPTRLKIKRRTLDLGASFKPGNSWRWDVDVQRDRKKGERAFSGGVFLLNANHFAAPVDYTTDRVSLNVDHAGEHGSFAAALSGSWFDNGVSSVTWDNPFTPIAGTGQLRAALAPDNQAWQFRLGGAWRPWATVRVSGRAILGRAEQDESLLPYTINDTFPELPLPRQRLDGRVDAATLNLAGKLNARLSRKLDLSARIKWDERDNRTPVSTWTPVNTDVILRPETFNRPYSFERGEISLDANYRARPGLRLRAGLQRRDIERTLQSVEETEETGLRGEIAYSGPGTVRLRLKLETWERDASPYLDVSDTGLVENPLMRKFHLADRDRDRVQFELDVSPLEALDIALSAYFTDDEYRESPVGLSTSEDHGWNLDASYVFASGAALHAFISQDRIDALILGEENLEQPWRAVTRDRFTTFGLGLSLQLKPGLDAGLDYFSADSTGSIRTDSGAGEPAFPDLATDLRNLRLRLDYRLSDQWDWRLYLEHENYDSRDWQVDGLDVDGISAVMTLGVVSPDYSVTVFRLLGHYRF